MANTSQQINTIYLYIRNHKNKWYAYQYGKGKKHTIYYPSILLPKNHMQTKNNKNNNNNNRWSLFSVYINWCMLRLFVMEVGVASCFVVPILLFWWCMHNICKLEDFNLIFFLCSGGKVGSSFSTEFASNSAMM